jgi:S-disulfanyl-L-cysteine oxidoreductase SoxD
VTLWPIVLLGVILSAPAIAQSAPARSTTAGVYNREQASRGQDVYLGQCRSCHTPEAHASATFQATWNGKSLAELFGYLRDRMPKSEPGTLSEQEYIDVLTYLLRLNRMPAGSEELPADAATLKAIRFETTTPVRRSP